MNSRIRTIKPELLEDERVAALSDRAFRLFIGALLMADDGGNLRAEPRQLLGRIFWGREDVDAREVQNARDELAGSRREDEGLGLIMLYRVRGQTYAHITKWAKHQKIDKPSTIRSIPSPDDKDAEIMRPFERQLGLITGPPDSLESVSRISLEKVARVSPQEEEKDQEKEKDEERAARGGALSPTEADGGTSGAESTGGRRRRPSKPESECPPSSAGIIEVKAWCTEWGLPLPEEHAEFVGFLNHHRAKGSRFRDWLAAWRKWEGNARKWGAGPSGILPLSRQSAPRVQPYSPDDPWLREESGG